MAAKKGRSKRSTKRTTTKAQKQRTALWDDARNGPFQTRDVMNNVSTVSNGASWLRSSTDKFQPSNHGSVRIVLDCQHARARTFGLQTASQFGFGVYDLDIELVPSNSSINPENGRLVFGEVNARWIEPTPLRLDALRHLKGLERMEDTIQPFTRDEGASPAANPLLSTALDDADPAGSDVSKPVKGSRIIRFGWDPYSPYVFRQSNISVDLNSDGDTSDNYESQWYVLNDDDQTHFGIMPRMESAVNPMGSEGNRMVDLEWFAPMVSEQVLGTSSLRKQVVWALNSKLENSFGTNLPGGLHTKVASFRGIRALGGLIQITIPEFNSSGVGLAGESNNDYELIVNLRCRKWTPQA